jgi:outer membrane protein insertion porin family
MNLRTVFCFIIFFLFLGSGILAKEPSRRLKVSSVTFVGNQVFSDHRLQRVMLTRPSGFLSRSYYYPEIFEDDLKSLVLFYQQNGYLEAQIEDTQVNIDTTNRVVHVHIRISEGELTLIEGVTVFGNYVFSDSLLFNRVAIKPKEPFKRMKIQDATLSLLTLYANSGYLEAEVKRLIEP